MVSSGGIESAGDEKLGLDTCDSTWTKQGGWGVPEWNFSLQYSTGWWNRGARKRSRVARK